MTIDSDTRHRMISDAAWHNFAARGFVHGFHETDWFEAERAIDAQLAHGTAAAADPCTNEGAACAAMPAEGAEPAIVPLGETVVAEHMVETAAEAPDPAPADREEAAQDDSEEGSGEEAAATDDDLEIIEGIGPKIAGLLHAAEINTFAQLADTPVATLQSILDEGGPRFASARPDTWPDQAALAARGEWDAFRALTDRLAGGIERH